MRVILQTIVDKLMSGRYSMLILFGLTICMTTLTSVYLLIKGRIEKEIFMTMFGVISTNFTMMWKDYMAISHKIDEQNSNGKPLEVKP